MCVNACACQHQSERHAQSPINIVTDNVLTESNDVGSIEGTLFDEDIFGYIANTGRMVQFVLLGFSRPSIGGGPLLDKKYILEFFLFELHLSFRYAFSHIDFHFGSENSRGSEHSLDGEYSPLEMEIVFYDGHLQNMNDVQYSQEKDSITVISFLFEVDIRISGFF